MKPIFRSSCCLLMACVYAAAQQPGQPSPTSTATAAASVPAAPVSGGLIVLLAPLERAAHTTSLDLAHLRIEKWKGDRAVKEDAAAKTESLERNLTGALPGMVEAVRANPNNLAPGLKLYRNLNAVYDVLAFVAEAAGAFAPKDEFRALAADLQEIDTSRRALADALENMASAQDQEVARLRAQIQAATTEVKKIVVDDTEPAPKPKPKRKKKPSTTTTSAPAPNSQPQASAPKPQ
jgi:hypothetical protein